MASKTKNRQTKQNQKKNKKLQERIYTERNG